jgi:predicted MPP superfamily phosphohydrolase
MRRFWNFVYIGTLLNHVPFAIGLRFALARLGVPLPTIVAVVVALVLVALLRGRVRGLRDDKPVSVLRSLLIEEPYFVHWCATVVAAPLFLLGALVVLVAIALGAARREALEAAAAGAYLLSFAVAAWGVFVRRRWVRVRTLDVRVSGLGAAFDGYRIAQLSDLHIGSMCPRSRADRWRSRVNDLAVDLVALTGDYVTSGVAFHHDIAAVLTAFEAKDGTVAVMGNHDYFGDGEPLVTLLRDGGVRVLRNEHITLERAGDRVTVAGVDDTWTRRANVERTVEGCAAGVPIVALAHDPKLFPELARRGASLVLSGHTHWGQIAVPFAAARLNLSRASRMPYHAGLFHENGCTLYVNPGLGTTGPPIRFGSPPEITILRLRAA